MALAYNGPNARICCRCGFEKSHIINVRDTTGLIKRRRECPKCGFRWSTVEVEQFTYERMEKADKNEQRRKRKGGKDNV